MVVQKSLHVLELNLEEIDVVEERRNFSLLN